MLIDPSRVAGVREYRMGDPLRFVDWRATARSTMILVREFEPSVTPRVAVFLDFKNPTLNLNIVDAPELEFTVAVAASIVTELVARERWSRRPVLIGFGRGRAICNPTE